MILDKLNDLVITVMGILAGISAYIVRRLFRSGDKAHSRLNVLERELVDRPYLDTQLAPIRQDLNLILKHLLEKK